MATSDSDFVIINLVLSSRLAGTFNFIKLLAILNTIYVKQAKIKK